MHLDTATTRTATAASQREVTTHNASAFHRQANQLAYAETSAELYSQALLLLLEVTAGEAATYLKLDHETDQLVVEAVCGDEQSNHLVGLHLPRQEALVSTEQELDQPILIGDFYGDPRWMRVVNPASAARMVNLISLPLKTNHELWGLIQVYNYQQSDFDLDLLEILSERIAIEFERWEAIEHTQTNNQRLLALLRALGDANGLTDRKQILQTILNKTTELVDAERVSIFLNDPASGGIKFQMAYHPTETPPRKQTSFVRKRIGQWSAAPLSKNALPLVSRSAITVPIQLQTSASDTDEGIKSLGGLMAFSPSHDNFTQEDVEILSILAQQTGNFLQVAEIFESTEELFLGAIKALVAAIDAKDPYTQGHSQRVSEFSILIAMELGLTQTQINDVRIGSLLHDVGKIGIPDAILRKQGALSPEEWTMMKGHPLTGWTILRQVQFLEPVLPAIIEHHEKLDGSGYPYGLKGNQISILGRIVAVADVFDAMTSDRPYRSALKTGDVLAYLEENSGALFDAQCVRALKKVIETKGM